MTAKNNKKNNKHTSRSATKTKKSQAKAGKTARPRTSPRFVSAPGPTQALPRSVTRPSNRVTTVNEAVNYLLHARASHRKVPEGWVSVARLNPRAYYRTNLNMIEVRREHNAQENYDSLSMVIDGVEIIEAGKTNRLAVYAKRFEQKAKMALVELISQRRDAEYLHTLICATISHRTPSNEVLFPRLEVSALRVAGAASPLLAYEFRVESEARVLRIVYNAYQNTVEAISSDRAKTFYLMLRLARDVTARRASMGPFVMGLLAFHNFFGSVSAPGATAAELSDKDPDARDEQE